MRAFDMPLIALAGGATDRSRMPGPWHELPFPCKPCRKGFKTRSQLKIHEGTQTKGRTGLGEMV